MHTGGPLAASGTLAGKALTQKNASSEAAILVAVRVRPFNKKEEALLARPTQSQFGPTARNFMNYDDTPDESQRPKGETIRKVVHTIDDHVLVFDPPDEDDGDRRATVGASNKRHKDIRFVFDRVYGDDSTQRDVYEGTTRGLLDSVMNGYNATVFAYGATGCGKTYTISGCPEDPGVIFLTMQELFERMAAAEDEKTFEVTLSYLEVYNETIRDLLGADSQNAPPLALREDAQQSVTVTGLSEHIPKNVDEVMDLMVRGNANRTMSPTEANAVSSRSHAVLQVHVKQKPKDSGLQTDVTSATLSLIDLAGSERATVARNNGTRMREGANINRSLLALANCINALCDHRTKRHIPYRDSKLTRLLKFSLGGNCRTVMITCVSPASTYYEETHNTLKYANRAKNIKTTVAKNTKSTLVHLSQYQGKIREQSEEIKRLQREISLLKNRPGASDRAGLSSRNASSASAQGAHAMAELRKQTQAIQIVQDMRNKMANAYAPIREAKWEHASAYSIGQWYDYHADSLRGWREQFEKLFQEQQHLGAQNSMDIDTEDEQRLNSQCINLRQQVDDLLRELTRERKTISRHEEHSSQLIERNTYMAERAAQVPPSVQLTAEQRYQVDQEHRVLDLSAERNGLRRRVELAEYIADDLAKQNTALLQLAASCMHNLKRAMFEVDRISSGAAGGGGGGGGESSSVGRTIDQVYMQAISAYGEVTRAVRASMQEVQTSGGPAKMHVSGSTLTPPSPYVPRMTAAITNGSTQRASVRNPNTAAISAAVAGTTRTRRTTILMPAPTSFSSTSGPAVPPGRHVRLSPVKRTRDILGRGAVRFTATESTGRQRTGAGTAASQTGKSAPSNGTGGGTTTTTTTAARPAGGNTTKLHARRAIDKTKASSSVRAAASRRRNSSSNADTIAAALRSNVTITSPEIRKGTGLSVADTSSISLPSPTMSNGSIGSPASSVTSWASAETSPHHEPLPAAARPVKGILKGASANGGSVSATNNGEESVAGPGPVRLGSVRRKSRHARTMANPMARNASVTPTKTGNGTSTTRELSFKSLAPAAASVGASSAAAAAGNAGGSKKPGWR
ncbi:tubulin-dependent ATPase kip3 [Coemansia sp. Benny D115]|nr:tubulin-dependent ATPase kip3 [Coemansia sp. Benny D115]